MNMGWTQPIIPSPAVRRAAVEKARSAAEAQSSLVDATPPQRRVLWALYKLNLARQARPSHTPEEVAEVMDLAVSTVKRHLQAMSNDTRPGMYLVTQRQDGRVMVSPWAVGALALSWDQVLADVQEAP